MVDGMMKISPSLQPDRLAVSPDAGKRAGVSIVIPMYNEVENAERLYLRLKPVLDELGRISEVVLIDDGSTDGTYEVLLQLHEDDDRVRIVRLRRNFGQSAGFAAGFDLAQGEVIITMDGDLQNDPADIPRLVEKIDEGYDVVSGWRVNRQDKYLTRKVPSRIANALISKVTGVELHDYGCSLKAYRWEVVKNVRLYGELHRFIPALASWMGIRITEVPVNHFPRQFGRSKYGLNRTVKVFLDLLTVKFLLDYATRPLQIFGLGGLLSLAAGLVLAVYLTIQRLVFHEGLRDRPALLLAILLIMLGVQLITMGLLGELVVRTYHESQDKPIYAIRNTVGWEEDPFPSGRRLNSK
jgi:glycosyltransferase involved in cell wall biosynthesis